MTESAMNSMQSMLNRNLKNDRVRLKLASGTGSEQDEEGMLSLQGIMNRIFDLDDATLRVDLLSPNGQKLNNQFAQMMVADHVVDGDGGGTHTTISSAVGAAQEGDSIFIMPGTYQESFIVNKELMLFGADPHSTVLTNGDDDTVTITSTHATLLHLTLKNTGNHAAVSVKSVAAEMHEAARIEECVIVSADGQNACGVVLDTTAASALIVRGCVFAKDGSQNNSGTAASLGIGNNASEVLFSDNLFAETSTTYQTGLALEDMNASAKTTVIRNTVRNCATTGISVGEQSGTCYLFDNDAYGATTDVMFYENNDATSAQNRYGTKSGDPATAANVV